MYKVKSLTLLGAAALAVSDSSAVSFNFVNVTGNAALSAAIGEAQLSVDVTAVGPNIKFQFNNAGPDQSTIAEIYFDDHTTAFLDSSSPSITYSGGGIAFSPGANPPNLPGAGNVTPAFASTFAFEADSPAPNNGVNPTEWVAFTLGFANLNDFDSVIAAMNNGQLRLGINMVNFANGQSEGFITTPNDDPENPPGGDRVPDGGATAALLGLGMLGLVAARKTVK
jgi:hypothetical protein